MDTRMVAAGALAIVTAAVVAGMTAPPDTTEILVTGEPIAAGARFEDVAIDSREVRDASGLIAAPARSDFGNHVFLVDLEAGSPIVSGVLTDPEPDSTLDLIGIELAPAAAVHGAIEPGDSIDLYLLSGEGAELIASEVPVMAVHRDQQALGAGDIGLLLGVDDDIAPAIAAAVEEGSIHLVRTGD